MPTAAARLDLRLNAAELTVTLSVAELRHFLAALDKPFKPNAMLTKAMADAARLAKPR